MMHYRPASDIFLGDVSLVPRGIYATRQNTMIDNELFRERF